MTNRLRICCTKPVSYFSNGDEVSMLEKDFKKTPFQVFEVENTMFWVSRLSNPEKGLRYATDKDEFNWQKHLDGVTDEDESVGVEPAQPKSRKAVKKDKGE